MIGRILDLKSFIRSNKAALAYYALLVLLGIAYACVFFRAQEDHSGYYGNAFKAIYPDSFPGDRSVTGKQPTLMSLFYLVANLVGEPWLDDRLHFVIYVGLAILAIFGVDRIAVLLGIQGKTERLVIIAMLAIPHRFKDNVPQIVDGCCYRPSTVMSPLAIWLAFLLFKGGQIAATFMLSLLMGLIAPKNAWYPAFVAFLFGVREGLHLQWRKIAVGIVLSLALILVAFSFFHGGDNERVLLFDFNLRVIENSEANPFMERGSGNLLYVLICVGAMLTSFPSPEVTRRIRTFFAVGLLMFFFGGLYYSYTPDILKIPFALHLAVNRSTWWPQVLSYLVLGCYALRLLDTDSAKNKLFGGFVLVALYLTPVFGLFTFAIQADFLSRAMLFLFIGSGLLPILLLKSRAEIMQGGRIADLIHIKLLVLLAPIIVSTMAYLSFRAYRLLPYLHLSVMLSLIWAGLLTMFLLRNKLKILNGVEVVKLADVKSLVLLAPIIVSTIAYLSYGTYRRLPHFQFLLSHGIMGDSPGAKWIGVNEFFRYETAKDSTVLAFSEQNRPEAPKGFYVDPSLRIRTGRAMPKPNSITFLFDYQEQMRNIPLDEAIVKMQKHWLACDFGSVSQELTILGNPDYLVMPTSKMCNTDGFQYESIKRINRFTILKRISKPGLIKDS
jgi:hypothetical protein